MYQRQKREWKLGHESEENWKNVQDIDFATELGKFFDIDSPLGRVVNKKTNNEGKNYFKVIQCWHNGRVCVCMEWNMESSLNWECQWRANKVIPYDWRTNLHFSFLKWNIVSREESCDSWEWKFNGRKGALFE